MPSRHQALKGDHPVSIKVIRAEYTQYAATFVPRTSHFQNDISARNKIVDVEQHFEPCVPKRRCQLLTNPRLVGIYPPITYKHVVHSICDLRMARDVSSAANG
jgi:hypothetical protein